MLASSPETLNEPPRVAFAVSRKVGTSVVRNRLRRQIRAHLGELRSSSPDLFPNGIWLFALQPEAATVDRATLLADVDSCIDRLQESAL